MLALVFFSMLWRWTGILTDIEFFELRDSGNPAALLRRRVAA